MSYEVSHLPHISPACADAVRTTIDFLNTRLDGAPLDETHFKVTVIDLQTLLQICVSINISVFGRSARDVSTITMIHLLPTPSLPDDVSDDDIVQTAAMMAAEADRDEMRRSITFVITRGHEIVQTAAALSEVQRVLERIMPADQADLAQNF